MGKDLLPLCGILLVVDETLLLEPVQFFEAASRRAPTRGRRNGRGRGYGRRGGRLAPDGVAEALGRGDRGKDQHPLLRRRFHDYGSVAEHPAEDALLDADVLDLLQGRLLDLARVEPDLPDDAAVRDHELVLARPEPPDEEREKGEDDDDERRGDVSEWPAHLVSRLSAPGIQRAHAERRGEDEDNDREPVEHPVVSRLVEDRLPWRQVLLRVAHDLRAQG